MFRIHRMAVSLGDVRVEFRDFPKIQYLGFPPPFKFNSVT
jgi:hypothetical protein